MISKAYPQMINYFGLISSFVYSSSYSTLGVYAGVLSGKVNRKVLLGVSCILWCASSYFAGAVNSFIFFCFMRFFLGAFESACNPASYSIIADYFPPSYRSTANAIETSGSYIGGGMASLCVILIKMYGWRAMYQIIGGVGIAVGALSLLVIKEPKRGSYDFQPAQQPRPETAGDEGEPLVGKKASEEAASPFQEFKDALALVFTNKTSRFVTIAGCFRFFETFSIVYFLPSFFQKVYPAFKTEYGLYSAMIIAGCGFLSTILGGLVSDRFERKSRMTKAIVCIFGSLAAIPAIALCTLTTSNFYVSLLFMGLKYLLAECWMSPAITMMQTTVKPEQQGSIVSAHLFYMTIAGCFSTVLLGHVANVLGAAANPAIYGQLIFVWNVIGYVGSVPFFWKAGQEYKKFVENRDRRSPAPTDLAPA